MKSRHSRRSQKPKFTAGDMYGSANRDERRWEGPEKFDVTQAYRRTSRIRTRSSSLRRRTPRAPEIRSIFEELVKRVERFELGDTERCLNNTLRGFDVCEVTFIDRNRGRSYENIACRGQSYGPESPRIIADPTPAAFVH